MTGAYTVIVVFVLHHGELWRVTSTVDVEHGMVLLEHPRESIGKCAIRDL